MLTPDKLHGYQQKAVNFQCSMPHSMLWPDMSLGNSAVTLTSPSRAAVPDRLFIRPTGYMWFVEFKQEGKKPTPPQKREHHRLREKMVEVWVIDSVESGKLMVDEKLREC